MSLSNIILVSSIICWLVLIFNGPISYFQYFFLGSIVISPVIIWLLIVILVLLIALIKLALKKRLTLSKSKASISVFTFFAVLVAIIAFVLSNYFQIFEGSILSFVRRYFPVLISPILLLNSNANTSPAFWTRLAKLFCIMYIPCGLLGIFQTLQNQSIIDAYIVSGTVDGDAELESLSGYAVYGGYFLNLGLRSFSFYRSPLDFGFVSILVSFISFAYLLEAKSKKLKFKSFFFVLFLLATTGAIFTFTRNIILSLILGLISTYILSSKNLGKIQQNIVKTSNVFYANNHRYKLKIMVLKNLPVIMFLALVFTTTILIGFISYSDQTASLLIRFATWTSFFKVLANNLPIILFGRGNPYISLSNTQVTFDNTYLSTISFSGIIYLFSFIALYVYLYKKAVNKLIHYEGKDKFAWIAFTSFYLCYSALSIFNDLSGYWFTFTFVIYLFLFCKPSYFHKSKF